MALILISNENLETEFYIKVVRRFSVPQFTSDLMFEQNGWLSVLVLETAWERETKSRCDNVFPFYWPQIISVFKYSFEVKF